MLVRTHLLFSLFLLLIISFFYDVSYVFIIMVFIGTLFPDIDSKYSFAGKNIIFRPIQFFIKHRGLIHSIFFGILISIIIYFLYPALSYGFFIGFISHIFADSLTKEGVKPFYPFKKRLSGLFSTGGFVEKILFLVLLIVNALLIGVIILLNFK
jgi:inner membrane protein